MNSEENKEVNKEAKTTETTEETINGEQTEQVEGIVEDAVETELADDKAESCEEALKAEKKGFFKNKNAKYEKEIEELGVKLADMQDKCQRTLAEFDNFRKRTAKEKTSMYDDGVRDTIEKLLPIFDNLERAISSVEGKIDETDPLYKGVKMTDKQLKEILSAMGVEEIKALGEKFDTNLHAAIAHVDDDAYGENEVIIDMMKGYKYKDKVIRHSMVKVAN
ncbi:MAG: nucleotide exchange factor GrpE [Candidatus Metalachnospira sp.]|nr:nucleotide exchange factor GrpE [Candidatus Metalachnospira sp.]